MEIACFIRQVPSTAITHIHNIKLEDVDDTAHRVVSIDVRLKCKKQEIVAKNSLEAVHQFYYNFLSQRTSRCGWCASTGPSPSSSTPCLPFIQVNFDDFEMSMTQGRFKRCQVEVQEARDCS